MLTPPSPTDSEMTSQKTLSCDDVPPSDSLHSLIEHAKDKECIDITCDSQCPVSCTEANAEGTSKRKSIFCNAIGQTVWGVLLVTMSVGGFIFTPLDVMLWEKLNMRPGLPPYEWWSDPPDQVKMRVYMFNVTNHERFLAGLDKKMNYEEVGPIVYLEKLTHSNIRFNDNATLSYRATRYPIYLPDENTIDLNATLLVPNMALLGMLSFLHNANYFLRTGARLLARNQETPLFLNRTVYQYMWDFHEDILDSARGIMPSMVPMTNIGMLARVYATPYDDITVKVGPQSGHRAFFKLENYQGRLQFPGFDPDTCPDTIVGANEGVMYHQHITKDDVLLYLRKTVCKVMPLYFDEEAVEEGVSVYRYNLTENVFDRLSNQTDCYAGDPALPSGLSDASKCYYNMPMVMSYPHFYTGAPPRDKYVTGLQPDSTKHNSYVLVEPTTGIPFRAVARMQSNLRVHNLSGFYAPEFERFSNLVLPLGWIEYNQEGLPPRIKNTIYFMIVILPPLSILCLTGTFLLGCFLITKQIYVHKLRGAIVPKMLHLKSKNVETLVKNKILAFEKESFLKTPS